MNKYHLTITTVAEVSSVGDLAKEGTTYERVETEIKCIGATALARHLRAIAEELDPQSPKVNLHPPGYRTTNEMCKHVTPRLIRDNPQA